MVELAADTGCRIDGLVPSTPQAQSAKSTVKRMTAFETPAHKPNKPGPLSSPSDGRADLAGSSWV